MLGSATLGSAPLGGLPGEIEDAMAGAAPRDFRVDYGSLILGTGSARQITGVSFAERTGETFTLEVKFLSRSTTPALFAAEIDAVERALATPYQRLKVTVGNTVSNAVWYDFDPATGTGFDAQPAITKREDEDSGHSRIYTARIVVRMPADKLGSTAGRMGRRESVVNVIRLPGGRKEVVISGVYTGVPSGSGSIYARDQYAAQIAAYATAVLAQVDAAAAWELVDEPQAEVEDSGDAAGQPGRGRVLRFSRTYRQILFPQSSSATDDPQIESQKLTAARIRNNVLDTSSSPTSLDRAEVNYECVCASTLTAEQLVAKWENEIRGYVIRRARELLTIDATIVREERPEFNFEENRITASIQIGGQLAGETIFGEVVVEDSLLTGQVAHGVWDPADSYAAYGYQGIAVRERTITVRQRFLSSAPTGNPLPRGGFQNPPNGIVIRRSVETRPLRVPANLQASPVSFNAVDRIEITQIRYFALPGQPRQVGEDVDVLPGVGGQAPQIGLNLPGNVAGFF